MKHLDEASYRALLAAPASMDAELREHLRAGCDVCSERVQALDGADALDGAVDALLLANAKATPIRPGAVEKILTRVGAPRRRWFAPIAVGAALAAAVGFAIVLRPGPPVDDGVKGAASLSVSASFAVVHPDGKVERGVRGSAYPEDASLSLRVELPRALQVSVVRAGTGDAEVLLLNEPVEGGVHDLHHGGQLAGVALHGQVGTQHVAVVASERALTADEARAAARGEAISGAATAAFDVVVRR
ncbi:MAG: hypothetical protein JST54_28475 [Deltaproteobacteria bacterium]|nr:hypothetical protein [Deltaproteobacteria bacterium]